MLAGIIDDALSDPMLRDCAIVQFLFLLDFLRGFDKGRTSSGKSWTRTSAFLKNKYPAFSAATALLDQSGNLMPSREDFFADGNIGLVEYNCLTLSCGAQKGGRFLDGLTEKAVGNLIQGLVTHD